MRVKINDNHISFKFLDSDGFIDMGCQIFEQEDIEQLLPYKRKHFGKSEQIIFDVSGEDIILLDNLLPDMDDKDIIDIVYELFYLIKKVEENGLLKRQCLWYKYDNIYYDTIKDCIQVAILPITSGFEDSGCEEWYGDFEDVVYSVISYLPDKKSEKIKTILEEFEDNILEPIDVLNEIDKLGCSVSTVLYEKLDIEKETNLKLIYTGKNGEILIDVDKDEFAIGRDGSKVDAVIPDKLSNAVSRKHCLITKTNNKYFVQDLESSNHTLVNGVMIPPYEIMEIEDNDILSIADLEFRVKINYIGG
jgi:hypothetical protein